ncbi:MAG: hypothetical protein J6N53_04305 [Lachnospiraceae bacterium]|nr:hypothetical protein [Lachnospiraceae bacterium]MBO6298047.1 hypothetical protein [Lachnospiraceae bacterium]
METVYLGLFSSLFKKIFNAILKPVIEFIGGLINKVFTWIFDNILKPLLVDVLLPLFKWLIELIYEILASVIYGVFAELLKIIDTIQKIFDVFAGIKPVSYDGQSYYMLDLFFSRDFVQKATWILISISLALMMAFAIIAVMRSMADLSGEMKNPVSKVLRLTFQCFLKLVMIPFVCMLLIRLSGTILVSVNDGLKLVAASEKDGAHETTMGRMIFCMASLDAAKDGPNVSNVSSNAGMQDSLRKYYYFSDISGAKKYSDLGQVGNDFKYEKFNFVTGFGVGLIFLMIMGTCVFKFINRIFNVILLYITAPLFVCSMPLDEGKNYNQWKEMFVGQLFSGYGAVIAMQIYLMVAPYMLDSKLNLMSTTPEGDIVIRMVFIIGGALAIESAGTMLTGLISSTAASMESAQAQQGKGLISAGLSLAKNVAGATYRTLKPKGGKDDEKDSDGKMPELPEDDKGGGGKEGSSGGKESGSNKFDGSKGSGEKGTGAKFEGKKQGGGAGSDAQKKSAKNLAEKSGAGKGGALGADKEDGAGKDAGNKSEAGAGKPGAKADLGEAGNKDAAAGKKGAAGGKKGGAGKPGMPAKPDADGKADADEEEEQEEQSQAATGGKKGGASGGKKGGAASKSDAGKKDGKKDKKQKFNKAGVRVTSSFLGGMFVKGVDKDGKSRWGLNLGSKFNFGLKKDGSVGCNVFGLASWKTDAEGNKTRSILGGAAKWGQDAEGNKTRSLLGGAAKWGENADGTKTRSLLGAASWKVDKDGNTTKISVPFMRFKSVDDGKGGKTFKLSKVQLTKGMKFKRAMYYDKETGALKTEMYCADFSPLGVKKAFDAETGKVETLRSITGDNFARTVNKQTGKVEYVKTHSDFLGRTKIYDRDKAGNYHVVASRGWVSSEVYSLNKDTGETTLLKSQLNSGFSLYDDFEAQEKSEEAAEQNNNGLGVPTLDAGPAGTQESGKKEGGKTGSGNAANLGAKKEPGQGKKTGVQGKAAQFSISAGPSLSADKDGVKAEAHTIQPAADNMDDIGESLNMLFNEEPAGAPQGGAAQFTMQSGPTMSGNKDGIKVEAHAAPAGAAQPNAPQAGAVQVEAPQPGAAQQVEVPVDAPQVEMPQMDAGGPDMLMEDMLNSSFSLGDDGVDNTIHEQAIESLNVGVPQMEIQQTETIQIEVPKAGAAQPEAPKAPQGSGVQFTMQSGPALSGNKDGIKVEAHQAPVQAEATGSAPQVEIHQAGAPTVENVEIEVPQADVGGADFSEPDILMDDVMNTAFSLDDDGADNTIHEQAIASLNADAPAVEPEEKIIVDEVPGATEINIVQKQLDGAPGSGSTGSSSGGSAGSGYGGSAFGGGYSGGRAGGSGSQGSVAQAQQAPAQERPVVEKHVEKEVEGAKIEIEQLVFADVPQGGDDGGNDGGDGGIAEDYGYPQENIADGFEVMEPEDFAQPEMPQVEAPQVNIPQPEAPQMNIPQPEAPKADMGRAEMPKPEMPNMNMSRPEMPNLNTAPGTGSSTGSTGSGNTGNKSSSGSTGGGNKGSGSRHGGKKK